MSTPTFDEHCQVVADLAIHNVRQTRTYGNTYVRAVVRKTYSRIDGVPFRTPDGIAVSVTWTGWGRSLAYGGHKYKAHARYDDTGRPVPARLLGELIPVLPTEGAR